MVDAVWVIVGKLGLTYNDLFYYGLDELSKVADGHYSIQREEWERARFVAYCGLLPHQKKGKKLKFTDVMEFPWEESQKKTVDYKEIDDHGKKLIDLVNSGKIIFNNKLPDFIKKDKIIIDGTVRD